MVPVFVAIRSHLPEILSLNHRYLTELGVDNVFYLDPTESDWKAEENYDLVISNYAYTELSEVDQYRYFDKILTNARCGYITDNSVWSSSVRPEDGRIKGLLFRKLIDYGIRPFSLIYRLPTMAMRSWCGGTTTITSMLCKTIGSTRIDLAHRLETFKSAVKHTSFDRYPHSHDVESLPRYSAETVVKGRVELPAWESSGSQNNSED